MTVENFTPSDSPMSVVPVVECHEVRITINDTVYKISEYDGLLNIRIDGDLLVLPKASNVVSLKGERNV
jgi:hypothetical protein